MTDLYEPREQEAIREATETFYAEYPNACRECGGRGFAETQPTRVDPGSLDPCPDCLDQGFCPLCGNDKLDDVSFGDNDRYCRVCGWCEADAKKRTGNWLALG